MWHFQVMFVKELFSYAVLKVFIFCRNDEVLRKESLNVLNRRDLLA